MPPTDKRRPHFQGQKLIRTNSTVTEEDWVSALNVTVRFGCNLLVLMDVTNSAKPPNQDLDKRRKPAASGETTGFCCLGN